ncbi:hypothetical protein Tsubulata_018445, partial [Turnera subulata]
LSQSSIYSAETSTSQLYNLIPTSTVQSALNLDLNNLYTFRVNE